jgi:DNA-binding transcriptional MerR regulator
VSSPRSLPPLVALPDKEYFKIGEVARLVGVKPYVLRYWESEFPRDIRPERTRSNQRMYRRRDVETFLRIKQLRYDEQVALPGARRQLRVEAGEEEAPSAARERAVTAELGALRGRHAALVRGLEELLRIVDDDERSE